MKKYNEPVGSFELNKYKNILKNRIKMINSGSSDKSNKTIIDKLSQELYPQYQTVRVKDKISEGNDIVTIVLNSNMSNRLVTFKAGQFINIKVVIKGCTYLKKCFIASSPKMALEGIYNIILKKDDIVSNYLINNVNVGDILEVSKPYGDFNYNSIRDQKRVIGIANDLGICAFYSLALAILDGDEDFELTIFYSAIHEEDFILKEKLDDIVCKTNKVKIFYVIDDDSEQYEKGPITINLIRKELYDAASFFIAGTMELINDMNDEFKGLKLPRRFYRYESTSNILKEQEYRIYNLILIMNNETINMECQSNETIYESLVNNNIVLNEMDTRCKLILGSVKILNDNRTYGDTKYNYINITKTMPESDLKIEIFN